MALSVFKEKPGEFLLAPDAEEMRLARELMSNIDGFLTAVVVGPEPIEPSEWLRRVGCGLIAGSAIDQRMGLLAKVLVDRHDEIREAGRDRRSPPSARCSCPRGGSRATHLSSGPRAYSVSRL